MLSKLAALILLCAAPTLAAAQTTQIVTRTGPRGQVIETDTTTTAGPTATQAAITLGTSIVPGSGVSPATSLSPGAGAEESALLEAVAVREAAAKLVGLPIFQERSGVLIVAASTQTPDASAWRSFTNQVETLKQSLSEDIADLMQLDQALREAHPMRHAFVPALAVALPVAQKILSYANTSYSSGGVALAADDYLAEVALLKAKRDWQILGQNVGVNSEAADAQLQSLRDEIADVKDALRKAKGDLDPADHDGAAKLTISESAVGADVKAATDYISAALAPAAMSAILQSQLYSAALTDPQRGVLYLRLHSASGGTLTKTTFWSNLGIGMPISNSIDLKMSYVFYSGSNPPVAGEFDVATRNLPADKVLDFVQAYEQGGCGAGGAIKADLAKACPITIGLP